MKNKRGDIEKSVLVELILIGIVFAFFLIALGEQMDGRGVKQDIVENQIALLIEASVPGMVFEIPKTNPNGAINNLKLENSRVYAKINGLQSRDGRPYFSRYNVSLEEESAKYVLRISDEK